MGELTLSQKIVDLGTLRENIEAARSFLNANKLAFVVKSDAYGHGIKELSSFVADQGLVDYLAVTSLAEANSLRKEGINLPILMLTPPVEGQLEKLISLDIEVSVASLPLAKKANEIASEKGELLSVHVVVDTGMGRFGVLPDQVEEFFARMDELSHIKTQGIFSHCSVAGSEKPEDKDYTNEQIDTFRECLQKLESNNLLPPLRHIANSAAFESFREKATKSPLNMVRLGTLLYGCNKVEPSWKKRVTPIMEFKTKIIELRELPPERYISYARTFKTERKTRVAILPIGHCDGLDRRLSNKAEFLVNGEKVPVIGKICSNHTMVDVTELNNVQIGDSVKVFGKDPNPRDLSELIGSTIVTIWYSYSRNISRVYKGGN